MSRDTMKKVGAKTRSKVQNAVASRKKGISAKEISTKTGIQPATVRLHLLALKKGGIIKASRSGRSVIYTTTPSTSAVSP